MSRARSWSSTMRSRSTERSFSAVTADAEMVEHQRRDVDDPRGRSASPTESIGTSDRRARATRESRRRRDRGRRGRRTRRRARPRRSARPRSGSQAPPRPARAHSAARGPRPFRSSPILRRPGRNAAPPRPAGRLPGRPRGRERRGSFPAAARRALGPRPRSREGDRPSPPGWKRSRRARRGARFPGGAA